MARPESQTSYQHLCELSKPSVLPVCALRTGWLLPFWMKPHKTSFIIRRWRLTVLYLNTDDFMVIADNGRVLGLGFIRAHLERRGKTVRWLWRAFIFSLQLRSSNLSGFSVETSNNYPPYTLKHTHMWVCFRSGWCHVSTVEWSSEGCMFPFSAFWLLHMQNVLKGSMKQGLEKFYKRGHF